MKRMDGCTWAMLVKYLEGIEAGTHEIIGFTETLIGGYGKQAQIRVEWNIIYTEPEYAGDLC